MKHRISIQFTLGSLILCLSSITQACRPSYLLGDEKLILPCLEWFSSTTQFWQAELLLETTDPLTFRWGNQTLVPTPDQPVSAIFDQANHYLYIPVIDVQTTPEIIIPYQVVLKEDGEGLFTIKMAHPRLDDNHQPVAMSYSGQIDPAQPVQEIQLQGDDPDGDTLDYELLSPPSSNGYAFAYLDPDSHKLYLPVENHFTGEITLFYRVTDGKIFSEPATIQLFGETTPRKEFSLGSVRVAGRKLAGKSKRPDPGLSPRETFNPTKLPVSVNLSDRFPVAGYQGTQQSCVGWSIAYAIKSYQEALEGHWTFEENRPEHLFSPAFIFNQLNGGKNQGIPIPDALDLVVNQGAATLATMPSTDDYTVLPSPDAIQEAQNYKAQSWSTLTTLKAIKTALAKNIPAVTSMAVYKSLYQLTGENSVYNTVDSPYEGDHAVTIIGYDDNFPGGGAFKILNSWGTQWGNQGYFWLPYNFLKTKVINSQGEFIGYLLNGVYMLTDQPNPPPTLAKVEALATESTVPEETLPNLQITVWEAQYDPQRGGKGILSYTIENNGNQNIIDQPIEIMLVLSEKPMLNPRYDEYYEVTSESIPFHLSAGQAISRGQDNPLPFKLPHLPAGNYYLHLLVDPYDKIYESQETDNTSPSAKTLALGSDQPDLQIDSFWVEWDDNTGEGTLEYAISNRGSRPVRNNWKIALMLEDNDKRYPLWSETITQTLSPLGEQEPTSQAPPFYISPQQAIRVNVFQDVNGNSIPVGTYSLVLMLDVNYQIEQSYYDNDISYSGTWVVIAKGVQMSTSSQPSYKLPSQLNLPPVEGVDPTATYLEFNQNLRAYNAKRLTSLRGAATRKSTRKTFAKQVQSRDQLIGPIDKIFLIPPRN